MAARSIMSRASRPRPNCLYNISKTTLYQMGGGAGSTIGEQNYNFI